MNHSKCKGFALIFVITTLSLMAAMLVVLGSASQKFLFETNTAYLDACSRNLSASGLAWSRYNINGDGPEFSAGRIPLDINAMNIPHATLSLNIGDHNDVTVRTFISRGKNRLHKSTTFRIR